jgi:hypothetical protein
MNLGLDKFKKVHILSGRINKALAIRTPIGSLSVERQGEERNEPAIRASFRPKIFDSIRYAKTSLLHFVSRGCGFTVIVTPPASHSL